MFPKLVNRLLWYRFRILRFQYSVGNLSKLSKMQRIVDAMLACKDKRDNHDKLSFLAPIESKIQICMKMATNHRFKSTKTHVNTTSIDLIPTVYVFIN